MAYVSPAAGTGSLTQPIVKSLFVASCLLSVVSWYTTERGMALYLSPWFAVLASLGIQVSLVLVAWLAGLTQTRRALLIAVYAITALVSIGFSYVSLYTWFSARERPALVQRKLYDELGEAAARSDALLSAAIHEGKKHVLALEEMTGAEKTHGYIARAQDADPYLAKVREAVAREGATYSDGYREGAGMGVRYSAFDRYTKIARQAQETLENAARTLAQYRGARKPLDASEKQLREFHAAHDAVPWGLVEETLHAGPVQRPAAPAYAENVDQAASSQEELMGAFADLAANPLGRPAFALSLAAFIDIVVFLLAYASGPYFFGSPEQRYSQAAAVVDASEPQLFVRTFLRKLETGPQGLARVDVAGLSPGERQLCLALAAKGLAAVAEDGGRQYYLLDPTVHEALLVTLAQPGMPLRAASAAAG